MNGLKTKIKTGIRPSLAIPVSPCVAPQRVSMCLYLAQPFSAVNGVIPPKRDFFAVRTTPRKESRHLACLLQMLARHPCGRPVA